MPNEQSLSLPRILVVDDSRIVRASVKKHLSGSFDIVEEADGEAGWHHLNQDPEIMVLMSDLSMPKLDGYGLLTRVRRSHDLRIKSTPVIIISGEEDLEVKNHAVDLGANDFVTKSTDRAEMVARVSAAVKLARTARELRHNEEVQTKTVTTDAKTGVGSEHLLHLEGAKVLAHGLRHQGEATLVLFELDGFDALNADIGEATADKLMGLIAKLVSDRLRKEETLARLGGPRFGVVLYADLAGSLIYAERLRETIAAAKINFKRRQLRVTASVGIANTRTDGTTEFDALLEIGMGRLASAAQQGGNRLVAPEAVSAMSVEHALALLASGEAAAVTPHLNTLLLTLQPLLELARRANTPSA
ncbi:MAG: response regulator [Burkholderiales bacterium]|nr:response regulator [Burkholderiales bacterium]